MHREGLLCLANNDLYLWKRKPLPWLLLGLNLRTRVKHACFLSVHQDLQLLTSARLCILSHQNATLHRKSLIPYLLRIANLLICENKRQSLPGHRESPGDVGPVAGEGGERRQQIRWRLVTDFLEKFLQMPTPWSSTE